MITIFELGHAIKVTHASDLAQSSADVRAIVDSYMAANGLSAADIDSTEPPHARIDGVVLCVREALPNAPGLGEVGNMKVGQ